jgi:hypothetical protein
MATVLEGVLLKNSILLCVFCGQKDSMQRIFINKWFLFTVGSVCHVKRFTTGSRNCHPDDEEIDTKVRKWLRQQSKDFYAAGFDAPAKRWDKFISVGGGYVEK